MAHIINLVFLQVLSPTRTILIPTSPLTICSSSICSGFLFFDLLRLMRLIFGRDVNNLARENLRRSVSSGDIAGLSGLSAESSEPIVGVASGNPLGIVYYVLLVRFVAFKVFAQGPERRKRR